MQQTIVMVVLVIELGEILWYSKMLFRLILRCRYTDWYIPRGPQVFY